MNMFIISAKAFIATQWAGGQTTQLFIYPENAELAKKDFLFRLSTATVAVDCSTFTPLPGVSRKLMVLKGGISLTHRDHHATSLNKFDTDSFEGDWHTVSNGQCTDFNLMTREGTNGDVTGLYLAKEDSTRLKLGDAFAWFFLYNNKGTAEIKVNDKTCMLQVNQLLAFKNPPACTVLLTGLENCELVTVTIHDKTSTPVKVYH